MLKLTKRIISEEALKLNHAHSRIEETLFLCEVIPGGEVMKAKSPKQIWEIHGKINKHSTVCLACLIKRRSDTQDGTQSAVHKSVTESV